MSLNPSQPTIMTMSGAIAYVTSVTPRLRPGQMGGQQVVDLVRMLNRDAVTGVRQLDVHRARNGPRQLAPERGPRDAIVSRADNERGNCPERVQAIARVVPRHGSNLFHHDWRLVCEVAAEERAQAFGELCAVRLPKVLDRHHELDERVPAHAARADARPEGREQHAERWARALRTVGKGAQEREAGDACRLAERHFLRDQAAHRVARHVKTLDPD